jgi:hypothetical protein
MLLKINHTSTIIKGTMVTNSNSIDNINNQWCNGNLVVNPSYINILMAQVKVVNPSFINKFNGASKFVNPSSINKFKGATKVIYLLRKK